MNVTKADHTQILDEAIEAIETLRSKGCHIHSITNTVAQNFTANVLLACGASVSMTANRDELSGFLDVAKSVHLNLGTIDRERIPAIREATIAARDRDIPIVLDPVMIHISELRAKFAHFVAGHSAVIKANSREIKTLGSRINNQACIVETGKTDRIHWHENEIRAENGTPMLGSTIATGCALGALIAALVPGAASPQSAALAGTLWFGIAGEIAEGHSSGPGSFPPALLDALHSVSTQTLREKARLS